MTSWAFTFADLMQCCATWKSSGTTTGVYPPSLLVESTALVGQTGISSHCGLAAKTLLALVLKKDYCQLRILQKLGLLGLFVALFQILTRNVVRPATRLSIAHMISAILTLFVNARLNSVSDLSVGAQCLRVLGSCITIKDARRQWTTLWTCLALLFEGCIIFQIMNMRRPARYSQLPRVVVWPKELSDEFETFGSLQRSKNVRAGRLVFVRKRKEPEEQAFVLAKATSGIFSRPDRHVYFAKLKDLHHPNVHAHIDFIEDMKLQYFVLEMVAHKPLIQFIEHFKRLSEGVAEQVLHQTLQALEYIHGNSVTHRDVKLENILVNFRATSVWRKDMEKDGPPDHRDELNRLGLCDTRWPASSVLLTNFDRMAMHVPQNGLQSGSQVGTAHYAAPEIQKRKYNSTVDIWSLGILGYVLLCAEFPYDAPPSIRSAFEVVRVVCRKRKAKWPVGSTVSGQAQDCIEKMLLHDPIARPPATKCLEHEWFNSPTRTTGGLPVGDYASAFQVSAHSASLLTLSRRKPV